MKISFPAALVPLATRCNSPAQEATSGIDLRATLTAQAVGSQELTQSPCVRA